MEQAETKDEAVKQFTEMCAEGDDPTESRISNSSSMFVSILEPQRNSASLISTDLLQQLKVKSVSACKSVKFKRERPSRKT